MPKKTAYYYRTWFVVFMLFLFFPVGFVLMWKGKKFGQTSRVIISAIGLSLLYPFVARIKKMIKTKLMIRKVTPIMSQARLVMIMTRIKTMKNMTKVILAPTIKRRQREMLTNLKILVTIQTMIVKVIFYLSIPQRKLNMHVFGYNLASLKRLMSYMLSIFPPVNL